jgi:uncharacterized membrane protein
MVLIYIFYLIGLILFWVLLYYVVKAAVRDGMREARSGESFSQDNKIRNYRPEKPANPEQQKLQGRYDKGEITFEEFQTEWNKLS